MAEGFDPTNYDTWPEETKAAAGKVMGALMDGNIEPLVGYLRTDLPIHSGMRSVIANMLDGDSHELFRLVVKGQKRGQRKWTDIIDAHEQKMKMGVFVEAIIRKAGRGSHDAAVTDAMNKFRASHGTVTKAHKYLRDTLAKSHRAPGVSEDDLFAYCLGFYLPPEVQP